MKQLLFVVSVVAEVSPEYYTLNNSKIQPLVEWQKPGMALRET